MIGVAFVVALFAHFLRSFKFWIIFNDSRLSLLATFLIFYVTSFAGFFIPVVIAELLRLTVLYFVNRNFFRCAVSLLLSRLYDVFVLSLILGLLWNNQEYPVITYCVAASLICFLIFMAISVFSDISVTIEQTLLSRWHNCFGLWMLERICRLSATTKSLFANRDRTMVMPIAITFLIWISELTSLGLVFNNYSFKELGSASIRWMFASVIENIPARLETVGSDLLLRYNQRLYLPHLILILVFIALYYSPIARKVRR